MKWHETIRKTQAVLGAACLLLGMASARGATPDKDVAAYMRELSARFRPDAAAPADVTSPSTNAAARIASMDLLDDQQKLGIGDQVSFRVVEDREEPKPLLVLDSGGLEIPNIGRIQAEGKTCKQVAGDIKAALEVEYYHKATVIVALDAFKKTRGRVYVFGQVRAAGPIEIPSDEELTVSKAILRAGGFTDFAKQDAVQITRQAGASGGASEVLKVDVRAVLRGGHRESDQLVRTGDVIYVPTRAINF